MSQQAPMLLQLFGQPELRGATGRVITRFAGGKSLHLLAILALSAGQDFQRVDLVAELWPGVSHEDGRNRLNVALHHVRKALLALIGTRADRALISSRGCLRLETGLIDVDIVRFELNAQQIFLQPADQVNQADVLALLEQVRSGVMLGYSDDWAVARHKRVNALVERLQLLIDIKSPDLRSRRGGANRTGTDFQTAQSAVDGDYITSGTTISDIVNWIAVGQTRILGVHGPAGVGKSRSVKVALGSQSDYKVIVIPCDALVDEAMLAAALAVGLDMPLLGNLTDLKIGNASNHIGSKPLVILFDNADQALRLVGNLAQRLVGMVPSVRIIITSREAFTGNQITNIRTYPLKVDGSLSSPNGFRLSPALQLFEKAAHRVAPEFEITTANISAVTKLCDFADGIPQAIELIASKVQQYAPDVLLDLLETEHVASATGGHPLAQSSAMDSLLVWSIQNLPASTQRFLLQCTVFPASFDAEAAAAITGREDAPKLLNDLVNASLIYLVPKETLFDGLRFRLLESVDRQCKHMLEPAAQQSLLTKHADYFGQVAASIPPAGIGRADFIRLNRFRLDDDNFDQAIGTLSQRDTHAAATLILSLAPIWLQTNGHQLRGHLAELLKHEDDLREQQRIWLYVFVAAEAESRFDYESASTVHRKIHSTIGTNRKASWLASPLMVEILLRDPATASWLHGLVSTWPEPMTAAVVLRQKALHTWYAGDLPNAYLLIEEALRLCQDSTPEVVRDTYFLKAQFCVWTLETVEARDALETAIRFYASSGLANPDYYVWQPLALLAAIQITTGQYEQARDTALRAWSAIEGLPSGPGMSAPLLALATAEALLGNHDAAEHWCLALRQRHSDFLRSSANDRTQWSLTDSHPKLSEIAMAKGNDGEAIALAASGWKHFSNVQALTPGSQMMGYIAARGTLSKAEHLCGLLDAAVDGLTLTLPLRKKYGIYRDVLAELDIVATHAADGGDLPVAARIYGGTYAVRLRSLHIARPYLNALHNHQRDNARSTYPGEWSKGTTMSLAQLIEDAINYLASR